MSKQSESLNLGSLGNSGLFIETAEDEWRTARSGASRAEGSCSEEVEQDAPPSNTASNKCNEGFFKPLRWGVDSLYLSFPGTLDESVNKKLSELKHVAQAPEAYEQAEAQYPVGEHIFEVKDKGAGMFPYVLQDNCFRISLSRPAAKSLPMAYSQISSYFLSAVAPAAAELLLRQLLSQLGALEPDTNVSRIDLYVDFLSDVDMESWGRQAWVTRAHSLNAYSVKGQFSGWAIGLGGVIACRLYDKTLEIETSGKTYLKQLWERAGWKEGQKVWRLEFEFKRELLTQKGLWTLPEVLNHLAGLWSYGTDEWLRLTLPSDEDKTRSRWPIHPLWAALASVEWGGDGGPLLPRFSSSRAPTDEYLFGRGLSLLFSYMAREGVTDFYAAGKEFLSWLQSFGERRCLFEGVAFDQHVAEQLAIRARRFNTILNPGTPKESTVDAEAAAYRRASDGE